ncbi:ATP-binding protein [Streptococcus pluranimalium]|uniref:ATP-binding protein n=1 Tax=Streptococcus pluranimalium TaxID=82348 RepID=UPI0039FD8BC8
MLQKADFYKHQVTLSERCPKHDTSLIQLNTAVTIAGEDKPRKLSPICPECAKEQIRQKASDGLEQLSNLALYQKTYDVLKRDSIIPKELQEATFDNFMVKTDEEGQLLTFAKGQAQKYLDGMIGNTVISGSTGIGKSHLSLAMAKAINEGYRKKRDPKSVLFVTLTEIIKQIKEGWNYGKAAKLTEFEAIRLLTGVDYLIIDDLGAKNAETRAKSDWEQDFLFDILNNRETTIINTNLDGSQLKKVYNERNASRILKGLDGNSFKSFTIKDKRYSIAKLKQEVTSTQNNHH